jgi:predicted component of type VI protein secretion system
VVEAAALLRVQGRASSAAAEEIAAPVEAMEAPVAVEEAAVPGVIPAPVSIAAPEPMNRERALATLLEVAAFFDRNEPQSIIGDSLRHVVRRANLSAVELLAELLPDGEQRALFLLRAGIGPGEGGGNDDGY